MKGYDRKNFNWEFCSVLLIMAGSVSIRFLFANFSKHLFVYCDELRYYMIAENIAKGRGLLIYNAESGYQKILYSLAISPAFWVSNKLLSIKIIAFINACLASSGILPIWLISKKILNNRKYRLTMCILYVIMADMTYTMTFMSEVLFMPLVIW